MMDKLIDIGWLAHV